MLADPIAIAGGRNTNFLKEIPMVKAMKDDVALDPANKGLRSQRPPITISSFHLLGIRLHPMTKQDILDVAIQALNDRKRCVIGNHNLHSLYFWTHESKMRKFYSAADYIQIDGMPLVWLGCLFGLPFKRKHRVTYLDLLPILADEAVRRQWRVFYLGSQPDVAEKAVRTLRTRYPGLQIATRNGYFDTTRSGEENQSVLTEIRDYAPDILLVGMGMPRQEIWINENMKDIVATVIFCCGGLMDYVAAETPTPPRWLGSIGLEWLFRLLSQPVRTGRRYLIEPWMILIRVVTQYFKSGHLSIPIKSSIQTQDVR